MDEQDGIDKITYCMFNCLKLENGIPEQRF